MSLYLLMTRKINTRSCFDTILISFIGINWMVTTINSVPPTITSLVLHMMMLILYAIILTIRYKGKENSLCTTLGQKQLQL